MFLRFRSNRTIVGLKRVLLGTVPNSSRSSNRTIVGLKLLGARLTQWRSGRQQSHHCGIETLVIFACIAVWRTQQSHHCGIETCQLVRAASLHLQRSNRTIVGLKPPPQNNDTP